MYETYSIIIKKGIINTGTPSGKNNTKNFSLWNNKPIIFKLKKIPIEKYKVIIKSKRD